MGTPKATPELTQIALTQCINCGTMKGTKIAKPKIEPIKVEINRETPTNQKAVIKLFNRLGFIDTRYNALPGNQAWLESVAIDYCKFYGIPWVKEGTKIRRLTQSRQQRYELQHGVQIPQAKKRCFK